jgi:hypothetical protein
MTIKSVTQMINCCLLWQYPYSVSAVGLPVLYYQDDNGWHPNQACTQRIFVFDAKSETYADTTCDSRLDRERELISRKKTSDTMWAGRGEETESNRSSSAVLRSFGSSALLGSTSGGEDLASYQGVGLAGIVEIDMMLNAGQRAVNVNFKVLCRHP